MTNYPGSLDTFQNPTAATTMDAAGFEHDVQHTNLNDAVAALQIKCGLNGDTNPACFDFRISALELAWGNGLGLLRFGTVNVPVDSAGGVVSGLVLGNAPVSVVLILQSPVGGLGMYAMIVGTPTADGFTYALSGITDSPNYKISYLIAPAGYAACGVVTVAQGQQTGQVTGLNFGFVPRLIQLGTSIPSTSAGGMSALLVGAPTADGFSWAMTPGAPDVAGVHLYWIAFR